MKSLEDLEKKINSELTTKINNTEIKHNQIYIETDKEDIVDVLKELEDDLNIMDDAYIVMVKEYFLDGNGKIRMQADDIEMIANGGGGNKGNIVMRAVENIKTDSKKFLVNATNFYRIATPGYAEIAGNSGMSLYSSIIKGVTDACALKDSKTGHQKIQKENNSV